MFGDPSSPTSRSELLASSSWLEMDHDDGKYQEKESPKRSCVDERSKRLIISKRQRDDIATPGDQNKTQVTRMRQMTDL